MPFVFCQLLFCDILTRALCVLFASDCQSLVNKIISGKIDRSSIGTVINDTKFASRGFVSAEFKHVGRQVNVAAHLLAKSCKNLSNLVIFHSTPYCIRRIFYL